MVAVPREQCFAMSGTVELPLEDGIPPSKYRKLPGPQEND
jgi:hypothetical protein